MNTTRFGVSMNEELLDKLDRIVTQRGYPNRSEAIRDLARRIRQPTTLEEAGISREEFEAALPKLMDNALNDSAMTISLRFPEEEEVEKVFRYMYDGKSVDF